MHYNISLRKREELERRTRPFWCPRCAAITCYTIKIDYNSLTKPLCRRESIASSSQGNSPGTSCATPSVSTRKTWLVISSDESTRSSIICVLKVQSIAVPKITQLIVETTVFRRTRGEIFNPCTCLSQSKRMCAISCWTIFPTRSSKCVSTRGVQGGSPA